MSREILERSEGNPFFLEEIIRALSVVADHQKALNLGPASRWAVALPGGLSANCVSLDTERPAAFRITSGMVVS
jgi:hypothetical protein